MVRFGILSTAQIGRKVWAAIRQTGNTVTVVGSRDLPRARGFVESCQGHWPFETMPRAVGSYEEVLDSADVDVVYVPLPTALRAPWVVAAAKKKKHVLCEKPCATSFEELHQMITACSENGVQFMDGVMLSHGKRLPAVIAAVAELGIPRHINSNFCFFGDELFAAENIRVRHDLEPFGCLGDLGWYNIRYTLHIMGNKLPTRVSGRILRVNGDDVPMEFSGELLFDSDDVSAKIFCSFLVHWQNDLTISGTQGQLIIPDFTIPFVGDKTHYFIAKHALMVTEGKEEVVEQTEKRTIDERSTYQEQQMIRDIASIASTGKVDHQWGRISLHTQLVMQELYRSATQHGGAIIPLSGLPRA